MKKYLLGLFAVVIAVTFSAFAVPQNFTQYYITDESDTEYLVEFSSGSCTGGTKLCSFTSEQSFDEDWYPKETIEEQDNLVFDRP